MRVFAVPWLRTAPDGAHGLAERIRHLVPLRPPRSRIPRIARSAGRPDRPPPGAEERLRGPECLACHTDTTAPNNRGEKFQVSDGIGCETCHGGSEHWLQTHDDRPKTAPTSNSTAAPISTPNTAPSTTPTTTHATNLAAGMRAMERPQVRAQLCITCHVGDSTRFATHQMMAAGHPRLAFELDTYTELWRTSGGREHFRRDTDYFARKGTFEPVQTWLAGLTATTRREAELVEQRIAIAGGGFPDFALFNCYSCHRSMRVAAWERTEEDRRPLQAHSACMMATRARCSPCWMRPTPLFRCRCEPPSPCFRTPTATPKQSIPPTRRCAKR